jgi:hypothetical protein
VDTPIPGIPSGVGVTLSGDGAVVGAATDVFDAVLGSNVKNAAYWTEATGWVSIGAPSGAEPCSGYLSQVMGANADGTVLVGGALLPGCRYRGFRWTKQTDFQLLSGISPTSSAVMANAVSADSSVVVGWEQAATQREPRYWDASGVVHPIGTAEGEALEVSADGKFIVGRSYTGAWIYTVPTGTYKNLGKLDPNYSDGIAVDVADDGNTVVGYHEYCTLACDATDSFIWTAGGGMVSLKTYLIGKGVSVPAGWSSDYLVNALSGTTFVGNSGGAGWIATVAPVDECTNGTNNCDATHGTCTDTPTSHTCGCKTGWTLAADGHTCTDLNECLTSCDKTHGTCTNTPGGFTCGCKAGYTLGADGVTCTAPPEADASDTRAGCSMASSHPSRTGVWLALVGLAALLGTRSRATRRQLGLRSRIPQPPPR